MLPYTKRSFAKVQWEVMNGFFMHFCVKRAAFSCYDLARYPSDPINLANIVSFSKFISICK